MASFSLESIYNWYRNLVANPKYRWWVIGGTMLYLLSPIDIAPDFLPFIGQIDDAVVITLLATEMAQLLKDRAAKVKQQKAEKATAAANAVVDAEVVEVK
ncbi:MAG: hypothetical protein B0A82_13160 [Alkalinema sp. CACIAM 70d]|uniref:YkvA family protein n=1 Tax=Alkalinema sp. FACHB-956 TaxID=2692768 RepID=UPI000B63E439|nr:YkvA family protein [Alkalinema sp. FACHB-956]MBD2327592.1 DUF1232 domain-containing protein [Alkalinema sp. FACHB-956]OUC14231.1 MAG: hypothetical protein B0A82_13160 [Alkalinema sp. CACIAM 70d]